MKVICIDGVANSSASFNLPEGIPLEVDQSRIYDDAYLVYGYEYDPVFKCRQHWGKRRFIPLSEIDETEMQRNYNTQHA